jgi:hypothetical protein
VTWHDDGSQVMISNRIELSGIEQKEWSAKADAARNAELPPVRQALNDLVEEVSVLSMMSTSLADDAEMIQNAAEGVADAVGDGSALQAAVRHLEASKAKLWRVANGFEDPSI